MKEYLWSTLQDYVSVSLYWVNVMIGFPGQLQWKSINYFAFLESSSVDDGNCDKVVTKQSKLDTFSLDRYLPNLLKTMDRL